MLLGYLVQCFFLWRGVQITLVPCRDSTMTQRFSCPNQLLCKNNLNNILLQHFPDPALYSSSSSRFTHSLTQRQSQHTAKWMWLSSAFPYFRFNSHRTRLEDPIRGDIELGGTGHRGGLIIPPAPLYRGKPIKSRPDKADGQQHLLPFSGWDYLLLTSSVDFFFFFNGSSGPVGGSC